MAATETIPSATAAPALTIAAETPLQDEVRTLIAELNTTLHQFTPPEFCYHLTVEQMAAPEMTVFVARIGGAAVGTGTLRRHPGGIGEVKRMYVRPAYQGQGIGGRILQAIEDRAIADGLHRLVLETGHIHHAAWRVYERGGFHRCGPVLDYVESEYSIFYEKTLPTGAGVLA